MVHSFPTRRSSDLGYGINHRRADLNVSSVDENKIIVIQTISKNIRPAVCGIKNEASDRTICEGTGRIIGYRVASAANPTKRQRICESHNVSGGGAVERDNQ